MTQAQTSTPAKPDASVARTSNTVRVGCKLPHGLLMEIGKRGDPQYKNFQLRGPQSMRLKQIVGGWGLTDVPKDFWDEWLRSTGKKLDFVKYGFVWAEEDSDKAEARAVDESSLRSGFERLDPSKPPKGVEIDPAVAKKAQAAEDQIKLDHERMRVTGAPN